MKLSIINDTTITAEFDQDEKEARFTALDILAATYKMGTITRLPECSVGTITISPVNKSHTVLYPYCMDERQATATVAYLAKEQNV